jgi:tetratricopeptide (TPR) repeat protein
VNVGAVIADRFEILGPAARGGMGAVYRALDRLSSEQVAIKVLRAPSSHASDGEGIGQVERFEREAKILAQLSHPGIVRYLAHGATPSGEPYLAMEWLEGETLSQRLKRGMTIEQSLDLVRRVADALGAAHRAGVVHRDVKPSNIFLTEGDLTRIKILDFGVARGGGTASGMTASGVMLGTPGYMAPEQVRNAHDIGPRADVFSLGCVLYACAVGRPPFAGEDIVSTLAKILLEETPRIADARADAPEALDALCARMMGKEPEERPEDGYAVAQELERLGALRGSRPPGVTDAPRALTRGERRMVSVVLVGAPSQDAAASESGASGGIDARGPDARAGGDTTILEAAEGDPLAVAAEAHGGKLYRFANGSALVSLVAKGTATDQAARAGLCALAIRRAAPRSTVAVATGRGEVSARLPVGEAIDRAARLLRVAERSGAVRIDELTAGLLSAGFDVGGDAHGLFLRGRREQDGQRTLLGRPTPCVGREREISALEGLFRECASEPVARVALVTGPAGAGKSRLRYEVVRKLRASGEPVEIWIARGDPLGAGSPFAMIAQVLRGAANLREGEPDDVARQKLRARVARHVDPPEVQRVSEFLGEIVGVPFPDEASVRLRAARQSAVLMGDQMRLAFEDFLAAECAAQPLVLVLDDLQWGDLPTVKFVDSCLRRLADQALMVLALARPEVDTVFPKLWAERGVVPLPVGGLTKKSAEKLVRELLGKSVSAAAVAQIVDRAAGNALYLEELIRAVADGGSADTLPETVLAMVQARLNALEPEARRVLRAASVFGQVFWAGGVVALLGGKHDETQVRDWLSELVVREIISARSEARFGGEQEFVFRHALVRDAIYATLTPADAALGHGLTARWLERAGERDAVVKAEHYERAGEPARAVASYVQAAEQALEGNDFDAVLKRAERGAACGAEGGSLGALRLLQAEACRWKGDFAGANENAARAMLSLTVGSAAWFGAAAEVIVASARQGETERLLGVVEALVSRPFDGEADGPHAIALARAAMQLVVSGEHERADAVLVQIAAAEGGIEEREPVALGRICEARAMRAVSAGNPEDFLRLVRRAAQAFEAVGDLRMVCNQKVNVGFATRELGAFGEAEHALREALAAAERMGLASLATLSRHNLGPVLAHAGRLDEARALEQSAIDACIVQGDKWTEAGSRIYLADILTASGDVDGAVVEATKAVELTQGTTPLRAWSLATLARLLLMAGRGADAGHAKEAMDILVTLGGMEEGESRVRLAYAEALEAAGDRAGAAAAVREAVRRLDDRAARIRSPQLRESFLREVAENAQTLELSSRLRAAGDPV